ncbi:hypothetical protein L208DRAFT_1392823 [Tricholoma matsutake]|nr:hypothetical protein L208DRAFT_1392823 [Tricholoma matsutake 945]
MPCGAAALTAQVYESQDLRSMPTYGSIMAIYTRENSDMPYAVVPASSCVIGCCPWIPGYIHIIFFRSLRENLRES